MDGLVVTDNDVGERFVLRFDDGDIIAAVVVGNADCGVIWMT